MERMYNLFFPMSFPPNRTYRLSHHIPAAPFQVQEADQDSARIYTPGGCTSIPGHEASADGLKCAPERTHNWMGPTT